MSGNVDGDAQPTRGRVLPLAPSALLAVCLLGMYQALLGSALLITPHWFTAAVYAPWDGVQVPVGLALLGGGAALLWVAVLPVRRLAPLVAAYLVAALNFLGMSAIFGRSNAFHGALVYGILAAGVVLLGFCQLSRPAPLLARLASQHPLAVLVHLIALVTGALMLALPAQYAGPIYVPMQPWLPLFGVLSVLLGGALFLRDLLAPRRWPWAAAVANLALAAMFGWWGFGFVTTRAWTGVLIYALLILGVIEATVLFRIPARRMRGAFADPLLRRVALTVATVLIATAVIMTLALTANNAARARDDAEANAEILAGAGASQLDFFLQTHLAVVKQVANLPSVYGSDRTRTAVALQQTQEAFPGFANLSLVDRSGQQIVRSSEGEFDDLGAKPYIQLALAGDPLVFGGITPSVVTGEPLVVMAAPVRNQDTKSVRGAVSASIQLPTIGAFLTDLPEAQDRDIFVLDKDGLLVAHSDPGQLAVRDIFKETSVEEALQQGASGSARYTLDGQRFLAGYARIAPYDWEVVVQQPEAVALAGAWQIEERAYLVLLAASILLAGLGTLLVDRLLRPIVALIAPLQAMGEGRYEVALPVAAEGQIGDLVRAFERMRLDLHEREVALAASEARFRSLIENGSDIVFVLNDEGVVRMVTPTIEPALGYVVDEFVESQFIVLVHPDDTALARELFAEVRAEPDGERRSALRLRHSDGSWRNFETVTQNRLADPSVAGIVLSLRDVTEQYRLTEERDRLYAELDAEFHRAAEIQAQLLPHAAPDLPGYEFAGVCLPARQVGGDFFDWLAGDDAIRLSLGDVMGKGMAASLLTATVRAALRVVEDLPVSESVEAVNRALSPDLAMSDSFITLFHAALEPVSGQLTYVDAGHGLVFIQRRDGSVEPLRQRGLPLGVFPDAAYPAGAARLEPGDTLVIYSDGLPDARPELRLDPEGVTRELGTLKHAQEKLDRLVSLVDNIQTRPDDLTLVVLRRRENAPLDVSPSLAAESLSR